MHLTMHCFVSAHIFSRSISHGLFWLCEMSLMSRLEFYGLRVILIVEVDFECGFHYDLSVEVELELQG